MKNIMNRMISVILVMALLLSTMVFPAFAAEEDASFSVYETIEKTTIRAEPYQDSKELSSINRNTLVYGTKSVTNAYGNIWIQTVDPASGQTGYVFSGKLTSHECEFCVVDGCETLMYCRCGAFVEQKKDGMNRIGATAALPRPVITPDIIAELGALGLAAKSTATAVIPYIPYVGVVVVCGVVVYVAVSVSQDVAIEKVTTDWKKLDKDYRPEDGVYYRGIANNDDGFFYIDVAGPMDEYEAMSQIDKEIMLFNLGVRKVSWFVYTVQDYDALNLVDMYINSRSGFTCDYTVGAHGNNSMLKQFKHYHITSIFNHFYYPDGYEEHYGGHVAFGTPGLDSMWGQGAWF